MDALTIVKGDPSLVWSEYQTRATSLAFAAMGHDERRAAIKAAFRDVDWPTLNAIVDGKPRELGISDFVHTRLILSVCKLRALVTRRREADTQDRPFWGSRIEALAASPCRPMEAEQWPSKRVPFSKSKRSS